MIKSADDTFGSADTNQDDKLDSAEWESEFEGSEGKFELFDVDGDGFVDRDEFRLAKMAHARFEEADANSDSKIDRQEWKAQLGTEAGFDTFDKDKDGQIDAEEFRSAMLRSVKGSSAKEIVEIGSKLSAAAEHAGKVLAGLETLRAQNPLFDESSGIMLADVSLASSTLQDQLRAGIAASVEQHEQKLSDYIRKMEQSYNERAQAGVEPMSDQELIAADARLQAQISKLKALITNHRKGLDQKQGLLEREVKSAGLDVSLDELRDAEKQRRIELNDLELKADMKR